MLTIDGSAGEGGGQVLRTALGLSLVTQTPFRIERIRGRREKPGLLRQHLTAVQAAATLSGATVEGDTLGSSQLTFQPRTVRPGAYEFSIGTAGSATLVLQAVLPALLNASGPTSLVIEGGTHNRLAPPYEFLSRGFLPLLTRMGAQLEVRLARMGFEPVGGGRVEVTVTPAPLKPLELMERGELLSRDATAIVSGIPAKIAERELAVVRNELGFSEPELEAKQVTAHCPGNALVIAFVYQQLTDVFVGLGARGITAENVARRTTGEVKRALRTDAPVGEHLADQLMIPLALAGGGAFRTIEPSGHTRTQLELIPRFLGVTLECQPESATVWRVSVR